METKKGKKKRGRGGELEKRERRGGRSTLKKRKYGGGREGGEWRKEKEGSERQKNGRKGGTHEREEGRKEGRERLKENEPTFLLSIFSLNIPPTSIDNIYPSLRYFLPLPTALLFSHHLSALKFAIGSIHFP